MKEKILAKNNKIKGKHILIIGAGETLRLYSEEIKEFIKNNDIIIFGCNNMNQFIIPDYHFWADKDRYKKFGKNLSKKSIPVFGNHLLSKGLIKQHKKISYKVLRYQKWGGLDKGRKIIGKAKIGYKDGMITGPFRNIGTLAIFYAYLHGSSDISIVGMDGFTLYSKKELKEGQNSQHCYGKGYSDLIGRKGLSKKRDYYKQFLKKDKDVYKILYLLKEYGVNFKIITPTVFKEFYDPDVLGIENEENI